MNRIKLRDNIDLNSVLEGFKDNGDFFELNGSFDEFIMVNKFSREIIQYGYNGLVMHWYEEGLLESF